MDPDDIKLISFFNAKELTEGDAEISADSRDEQAGRLSLQDRYRNWLDIIDR